MSFLSYGLLSIALLLGGLLVLGIFSWLTMAQMGDNYLDQYEFTLRQREDCPPTSTEEANFTWTYMKLPSDNVKIAPLHQSRREFFIVSRDSQKQIRTRQTKNEDDWSSGLPELAGRRQLRKH